MLVLGLEEIFDSDWIDVVYIFERQGTSEHGVLTEILKLLRSKWYSERRVLYKYRLLGFSSH